jgi:hypothetical protein
MLYTMSEIQKMLIPAVSKSHTADSLVTKTMPSYNQTICGKCFIDIGNETHSVNLYKKMKV